MSAPAQPAASQIGLVDAQLVEEALSLIAPKWTTWSAQTLAQQDGPIRVRDVAARLPFVSEQFVGKRLAQMHDDGLVIRAGDRHGAPYQLSGFGSALSPVHRVLADWSHAHLPLGTVAGAERVEDAVRRLHLRHSTAVIHALDAGGPGPVYAAIEHWSNPVAAPRPAPVRVAAATRTHTGIPPGSDGIRTSAALRRSTAAPSSLFSHAPQPQPRVPVAVAAQSASSRGR